MPQSKILVDTNTYIRLAKTIHPLLSTTFGEEEHCLYILPELNVELQSRRLQNKFYWLDDDEYVCNRRNFPNVSRKESKSIRATNDFVWDYVQTELPGPSKVDALYIAYGIELEIPVVTDDQDMTDLANVFDALTMSTVELLGIMLKCGHVNKPAIDGLCQYWRHILDEPANLELDYKRFISAY